MLLDVQNISKSFNEVPVLKNISFHLEDYDKAALIGINGAGKTTLLRCILGEYEPDEGNVYLSKDKNIGYLSQEATVDSSNTIYEELLNSKSDLVAMEAKLRDMEEKMSHFEGSELDKLMESYTTLSHSFEISGGLSYRSEIKGILLGLGFSDEDMERSINTLSGGQKTRVALSRLLVQKPDLIILDEPTNHLDMNAILFLENFLLNYKGAVLLVSHDRYFLDKVVNKVIEIENTKSTVFVGNYSEYAVKKEELRNALLSAYYKQQADIAHQEQVIKKLKQFNREKSIKRAESRIKALNKIERIEKPAELDAEMNITLSPSITSGNDVLSVTGLSKSFGDNLLFKNIDFELKRGEHVALIGDNGTGKTTILKIINALLPYDEGEIKEGTNVEIGYYDQEHQELKESNTLFDELSDEYPFMNNTDIRNTLAAFLFTGDDVYKEIKNLSGGEKGRLSLAKLMLGRANFLILDEPTNHLDITSKEILEDALNAFEGTILYVSHDRYFINRTASRIIELSQNTITEYLGNYDYYLEKKEELSPSVNDIKASFGLGNTAQKTSIKADSASDYVDTSQNGALSYKAQKEAQAAQRKRENELKKCEERIDELENRNKFLEVEMSKPEIATNSVKLQELTKEFNSNTEELESLYERWEELS